MEQRKSVATWALVAMLVIAALAACADKNEAPKNGQWGSGVYVDKAWSFAREVAGHRVHVTKEKIECTKCHEPTENSMGRVVPARCASCHEKQSHIQHAEKQAAERFGAGTKAVCTACHAFTLEGTKHDEAMVKGEAPRVPIDGGAGRYAMGVESYEPSECKRCHATAQGETPAVTVHGSQPCLNCHKPHEGAPQSAPCNDCHKDIATTHDSRGKSLVETCSGCHQDRHAPAKDALATCVECHGKEQPLVPATALFDNGHTACTNCHKPHDFEKKNAAACRSCHEALNVIGGGSIGAHNGCTNCHSPHDVKASAPAACPTCHKAVHSDHPKQAGACIGCHDPHPKRVIQDVVDVKTCTSCHKLADSDHGAHRGAACTGCHKPHDFGRSLAELSTCEGCHAQRVEQVGLNKGHHACQGCHEGLPHKPENEKACSQCHGREAALVKTGHAQCTQCHEPHSGAQAKACSNCHKAEQQSAPQGHQACTGCHEPHAGLPVQKQCTSCHAMEAKSPHGQMATGCQTCHRPHGPKGVATIPTCTTCHQLGKLPGLHSQPQHQPCLKCHTGHDDASAPKRAQCMSCHQDRANHFPQSPRCASCHLFTAGP